MGLEHASGFDGDFDLAERAIQRGWIRREDVESAMLATELTPGSRLLNHLPLTPDQLSELESPARAARPPEVDESAKDPARRVGHFVVVEKLSSGGMGRVMKAWDLKLSRWVALKFPKAAGNERAEAYFEREARLAAGLSHANIAAIYEVGRQGGAPYIAMQFIPGETLDRQRRRSIKTLAGWMRDAARAVAFANRHDVIHRDLKPTNLMATPDGRVFVLDFGLARPVEKETRITASGSVVGTPAYMSPEQARGEDVDSRADVYGLGATLYELLTGRAPFNGTTVYEVLRRVEELEPLPPRKLNPRIPRDLETIVLKALEKSPVRRYPTADELADDLQRYLDGEAIAARPASALYRIRKRLSKSKAAAVAAAALVALVATSALVVPKWRAAAREAEEERGRSAARAAAQPHIDLAKMGLQRIEQFLSVDEDRRADLKREGELVQKALEKALEVCPGHEEALFELGRAQRLLGHGYDALESFSRAIDASPKMAKAYLERALLRLMDYEGHRHRSGGGVEPETPKSLELLADIRSDLQRVHEWSSELPHKKHAEAMLLFAQGKWVEAAERWKVYLDFAPGDFEGWNWRGHAFIHAGRPADALAALDRAVRLRPRNIYVLMHRGLAFGSLGEWDRALGEMNKAVDADPNSCEACTSRGAANYEMGRYDETIADCTKALELDRHNAYAYRNRGLAREAKKLHAEAIADYNEALKLVPAFALVYSDLGTAKTAMGLYAEAMKDHDKAVELDPNSTTYANRGYTKAAQGLHDAAIEDYNRAIELDPRSSKIHFFRGNSKRVKGLYDEAMADYNQAIQLNPKYADAFNNRGRLHLERGKVDDAITDLSKAVELNPNNALVLTNLGCAKEVKGLLSEALEDHNKAIALDSRLGEAYCNRGKLKYATGHLDEAIEDFGKYIELEPNNWVAHSNRGAARLMRGLYAESILDFDKAIVIDSTIAATYFNRGNAKYYLGRYDEAIKDYGEAIQRDKKYADAWSHRGNAKSALGRHDEAIEDYTNAILLVPKNPMYRYNRGNSRKDRGLYAEAIDDYDMALSLDDKYAFAYGNRGVAKFLQGRVDEAILDYDLSIKWDSKNWVAWSNRGNAKHYKRLYDEAIESYDKAIDLNPQSADIHSARAGAKLDKGLLDGAIADCDEAIRLDPNHQGARVNRGNAKRGLGLFEEALANYEEAIRLNPADPLAYLNRGSVRHIKGLRDEAIADWKRALDMAAPDWPDAVMTRELIDTRGAGVTHHEGSRLFGLGKFRDAIERFKENVDSHPKTKFGSTAAYCIGEAHARLGEKQKALDWLEKAVQMGWNDLDHLQKDANLESLRSEARYRKVVEGLKSK